jgi:hypothetical protein
VRRYGYTALAHCAVLARTALGSKPLTILLRKRLLGPGEGGEKSTNTTTNTTANSTSSASDMRAHLCALSSAVVAAAADTSSSSSTLSSLRHATLTPPDSTGSSSGSRYYYCLHSDLVAPDVATRVIAGAGAGTLLRCMLQEAQEAANEVIYTHYYYSVNNKLLLVV